MLLSQSHQNVTIKRTKEEREDVIVARDPYLPLPQVVATTTATWQQQDDDRDNNSNSKLPLNFLHIPKTGGTSVVMAAAHAGYAWSDCMFPLRRQSKDCPDIPLNFAIRDDNNDENDNNVNKRTMSQLYRPQRWTQPHPFIGSWWHVPIQYLPNDHINPYQNQDLFVVVRNPYQRVLSQYYYRCLRDKKADCYLLGTKNNQYNNGTNSPDTDFDDKVNAKSQDTPQQMNQVVQQLLRKQQRAMLGSKLYFLHDGHWIPQSHYVYNVTATARNGNSNHGKNKDYTNFTTTANHPPSSPSSFPPPPRRLVQHILHFEYLEEQFPSLMQAYNYSNISLPQRKINHRSDIDYITNVTVNDLTVENLRLIEEVYHDDFVLGGYLKLSTNKTQT
jgi:hypothetical protein